MEVYPLEIEIDLLPYNKQKVKVFQNGKLVKTFNPKPGMAMEVADKILEAYWKNKENEK
jgi:hypothetical protein